jgi:hypothetical protein
MKTYQATKMNEYDRTPHDDEWRNVQPRSRETPGNYGQGRERNRCCENAPPVMLSLFGLRIS